MKEPESTTPTPHNETLHAELVKWVLDNPKPRKADLQKRLLAAGPGKPNFAARDSNHRLLEKLTEHIAFLALPSLQQPSNISSGSSASADPLHRASLKRPGDAVESEREPKVARPEPEKATSTTDMMAVFGSLPAAEQAILLARMGPLAAPKGL